jgi:hypothetical protein
VFGIGWEIERRVLPRPEIQYVQPVWPGVETVEGATRYVETRARTNHPVVDAHGAFQNIYDLVLIVRMQTDFGIGLIPQFDELRRLIAANLAYLELAAEFTFTQLRALLFRYAPMTRDHPLALLGGCQSHFHHEDLSFISSRAGNCRVRQTPRPMLSGSAAKTPRLEYGTIDVECMSRLSSASTRFAVAQPQIFARLALTPATHDQRVRAKATASNIGVSGQQRERA